MRQVVGLAHYRIYLICLFFFFLASNSSLDLRATFSQGQRPANWYKNALIFVHSSYEAYRLPSQLVGSVVSPNNTEGINGSFFGCRGTY